MKLSIIVSFTCIILNVRLTNTRPQVSEEQAAKAAVEAKDRALFAARTANKIVTEAGSQAGSNDLLVGTLLANVARAAANAAEVAARTAYGDRFSTVQLADVFRQAADLAQIAESNVDTLIRSVIEPGTKVLSGLVSRGNELTGEPQTVNSVAQNPDLKVGSILRSTIKPGIKTLSGLISRSNNVPLAGIGIGDSLAQIVNADVGSPIRSTVEPGTKNLFYFLSKDNLPVVEARIGDSVVRVPDSNIGALVKSTVAGTNVLSRISPITNVLDTRTEDGNTLASESLTTAMRTIAEAARRATIAASAVTDLTRAKTKAEAESKVSAVEQALVDAENFAQQAGTAATTTETIPGTEITSNIVLLVANAFAAAVRALSETAVTFVNRFAI